MIRYIAWAIPSIGFLGTVRGIIDHLLATARPPALERVVDELMAFALRGVLAGDRW